MTMRPAAEKRPHVEKTVARWVLVAIVMACTGQHHQHPPVFASPTQSKSAGDEISPTVVPLGDLGLPAVAEAFTATPDYRRIYVGASNSYDLARRNIAALELDATGKLQGIKRYQDSLLPLPDQTHITVETLLLDPNYHKLYVGWHAEAKQEPRLSRVLSVYDLDSAGDPIGRPRSYESGNPHGVIWGLARHPTLNLLYAVGWGTASVNVFALSGSGDPIEPPHVYPLGGYGKRSIAISPSGDRIYLGTYHDTLEVLDLDPTGAPRGNARVFPTGGDGNSYLQFEYTPKALFLSQATPSGPHIGIWRLDPQGDPVGTPTYLDVPARWSRLDPAHGRLWLAGDAKFPDAFSGALLDDGVTISSFTLDADGLPHHTAQTTATIEGQKASLFVLGPGARPLVLTTPQPFTGNRVKGYRLRCSVMRATMLSGKPPDFFDLRLDVASGGTVRQLGRVTPGTMSSWVALDDFLRDKASPRYLRLSVSPSSSEIEVRIDVDRGEAHDSVQTLDETVRGDVVVFSVPGYGMTPGRARLDAIELMSTHANHYLELARSVAVAAGDRPRRFTVSPYSLIGGQGHLGQLHAEAEALSLLGFNTVDSYSWGNLAAAQVGSVLNSYGLSGRLLAVYKPPSYFAFDEAQMSPAVLDAWATSLADHLRAASAASPVAVRELHLADEPGWYYPTEIRRVQASPTALRMFREFLHTHGLAPRDVGAMSWDRVEPVGGSGVHDLASRRLFYWTMRFFPSEASRGMRQARDAIDRVLGRPTPAAANWNNWVSRFYVPSPNAKLWNNTVVDSDTGYGSIDWFDAGRRKASVPWTEDWFGDADAEMWSFYGDALRSVAALSGEPFGSYVVGQSLGGFPAGGRYKILSLIGHGAKAIDLYTSGPFPLWADGWSESPAAYSEMADAFRVVGRSERLLFPGQPKRGNVALLVPGASLLWEKDLQARRYSQELTSLHYALVHAGYSVDLVDETDLATGALESRHYSVLYITEPDIPASALTKTAAWVAAGGTVAVTPGAAVADEYDTPSAVFDRVLGLKPREAMRAPVETQAPNHPRTDDLVAVDPASGVESYTLRGPTTAITPAGASVLATFSAGAAAITSHHFGKGQAIAYAFFPGWEYWLTADRSSRAHLPTGWGAPERHVAVLPARLANTPRPVLVDHEAVEACRLDSDQGTAIVLLNWTGAPLGSITVTVPKAAQLPRVSSERRGVLAAKTVGDSLEVTLPLEDVDVLMLEP